MWSRDLDSGRSQETWKAELKGGLGTEKVVGVRKSPASGPVVSSLQDSGGKEAHPLEVYIPGVANVTYR